MKFISGIVLAGGILVLALAFGFVFQLPFAIQLWPWPDAPLSYLFVGAILAAIGAAAIWIGWTGELAALRAGALNVFVIALTSGLYFLKLAVEEDPHLFVYAGSAALAALLSAFVFSWSRRIPFRVSLPTPMLVRVSFALFILALTLSGAALILRLPIFLSDLYDDSSVIFGCIFIGDAFYFLYGLFVPNWHNAKGQLFSFLAYDLVLIGPLLAMFGTMQKQYEMSLVAYVAVLAYSGAIAVYYLFLNSRTRFGRP